MKDIVRTCEAIDDDPELMERVARQRVIELGCGPEDLWEYLDPNGYAVLRRKAAWMIVADRDIQPFVDMVLLLTREDLP